MQIIGLMPCRNEAWCIGLTVRAALRWCDRLVVLDHASNDGTRDILASIAEEFPGRLWIMLEDDPAWNEADYRQRLLEFGRRLGGTIFATIDADELLTANLIPSIRDTAAAMSPSQCLRLPWPCLWRSVGRYRCDASAFGRARVPLLVADAPHLSHRPTGSNYQIHTRVPCGSTRVDHDPGGGVMHLQHAEWRRVSAKQALYRMTEVLRGWRASVDIERTYGPTTNEMGLETSETPAEWWAGYEDIKGNLRLNESPWQEAEVHRLLAEHGRERFAGLDLQGIR